VPVEPPPSRYVLPDPARAGPDDVVAVGGDLEPGTVLQAYRRGLFPMHLPDARLAWWSPLERGVIPLDGLRLSRALRRSMRRYRVTVDRDFGGVIRGCADPGRPHGWITPEILAAYTRLYGLGWAHSVEAWEGDELAGGLYGVAIGGAFFGESMFHRRPDASKVALVHLVDLMRRAGAGLLDVQWATDHLRSLGAVAISRIEYLERLRKAIAQPLPPHWSGVS
jgi:leucyl/phenylalanyl-tRNA---protein transferase